MHSLDFLSSSPHLFIFQKKENKTNLGGVLFLIYIIACIIIFLYFFLDYSKNNKYEIEYTYNYNDTTEDDANVMLKNNSFNPYVSLYVGVTDNQNKALSDKFFVVDKKLLYGKANHLETIQKISDIDIGIYYRCTDNNCSITDEDKRDSYYVHFGYEKDYISHQKIIPIYKKDGWKDYHVYEFS